MSPTGVSLLRNSTVSLVEYLGSPLHAEKLLTLLLHIQKLITEKVFRHPVVTCRIIIIMFLCRKNFILIYLLFFINIHNQGKQHAKKRPVVTGWLQNICC